MIQAFRESPNPAALRVKTLEARLAEEARRGLQLEKRVEALSERMLEVEKQMQAFLGHMTHPIAEARDAEPRIGESKPQPAEIAGIPAKAPRQARRRV